MANSNNYDFSDDDQEDVDLSGLDLPDTSETDDEEIIVEQTDDTFVNGLDEDDNSEAIMFLRKLDRTFKKYSDAVSLVKPASTSADEKLAKDFSTWRKAIKPATLTLDTTGFDQIIDGEDSTLEELVGAIRLLDKLKSDAENTLQQRFNIGKVTARKDAPTSVDLVAERKKLMNLLESTEQFAKDGTFDGLTLDRIYSCPNVKRKLRKVHNSNETYESWDVPMAPRQSEPGRTFRGNNSTMKLVIDGEIPENHPHFIVDAVRQFLGMSIRQFRLLAGNVWENNDHIFDWTDAAGVSHKIGQREVKS